MNQVFQIKGRCECMAIVTKKEIEQAHKKLDELFTCAEKSLVFCALTGIDSAYRIYQQKKPKLRLVYDIHGAEKAQKA